MALFTAADLRAYLRLAEEPSADTVDTVERVASGRLLGYVGLASWPAWPGGVPTQLWALALELGAIMLENPTSMSSEGLGASSTSWGKRAEQIADEVRAWARVAGILPAGASSPIPLPRGSFPVARPWPDACSTVSHRSPLADGVRD